MSEAKQSDSTDLLGPTPERVSVRVKRELFRFHSQQEWENKAKSWYANCGVRQGFYMAVDAQGHVMHMGRCFMAATERSLYPVVVYELQTNWPGEAQPEDWRKGLPSGAVFGF
jgi:hypothetical protein